MKVCRQCKLELEEECFQFDKRHQKHTTSCTNCIVKQNKEIRHRNREQYNKAANERRYARKRRAIEYKGGHCEDCKLTVHPAAFDFHHIDATTKHKDPGLLMGRSDEFLFAELDKCILLCSNCHRVRHFNEGF